MITVGMVGRRAWGIGGDLSASQGVVLWVGSGITKLLLKGWQESDGSESDEAAADEPWQQAGGEHAVSDGTLVYRSSK